MQKIKEKLKCTLLISINPLAFLRSTVLSLKMVVFYKYKLPQ
jgi:hypothetical protein